MDGLYGLWVLLWAALFAKVVLRHVVLIVVNAHAHIVLPHSACITANKGALVLGISVAADAADQLFLFLVLVIFWRDWLLAARLLTYAAAAAAAAALGLDALRDRLCAGCWRCRRILLVLTFARSV